MTPLFTRIVLPGRIQMAMARNHHHRPVQLALVEWERVTEMGEVFLPHLLQQQLQSTSRYPLWEQI